ncbi:MAG: hypothetical protein QM775_31760 [Pirellulales bacterium]
MQKAAVSSLWRSNAALAEKWRPALQVLALNWLREADHSRQHDASNEMRSRMQTDQYGNVYFNDDMRRLQMHYGNVPHAISCSDLLKEMPDDAWLRSLAEEVRLPMIAMRAELLLKTDSAEEAFPVIEELAAKYPDRASALAERFFQVWRENHDPNVNHRRTMNPFQAYYGFNGEAQSIPLTRSKQERNLAELAGWVARLNKLPLEKLNKQLLAEAFTACHSHAEVYRLEAVTRVFGPLETLDAEMIAALVQQMRTNLAGLWRAPVVQEQARTKRKLEDIRAEVLRGYAAARKLTESALAQHQEAWALHLAGAALELDESNFRYELEKDPEFQARRKQAMDGFARAARLYAAAVPKTEEADESTLAFEQWFHASLGACDVENIDDDKRPDSKQTPLIRAALEALPGEAGKRHREKFAANLFVELRSVKPSMKYRYLREGFGIVGDHPLAAEARKSYDYYRDLVSEIKLHASVDGAADGVVGHKQPFGVFVSLKHTAEIERESGGFGRFLQNQNALQFSYNYGRPAVDYRDRFTASITELLAENFEIVSTTFESDKVRSRETPESGWRMTPYAYLLLKARGPHVDRLPPLKIDLDFLDTSGYVVLPIESPALVLDAKPTESEARPVENLAVTQILDDAPRRRRTFAVGDQSRGARLVAPLGANCRFEIRRLPRRPSRRPRPSRIEVRRREPIAGYHFTTKLAGGFAGRRREGCAETPFVFADLRTPDAKASWQRYQDADLQTTGKNIALQAAYGKRETPWTWITAGALLAATLVVGLVVVRRRDSGNIGADELAPPQQVTPFSTIAWLKHIRASAALSEEKAAELDQAITEIEATYFAENSVDAGRLTEVVKSWTGVPSKVGQAG